MGEEGVRLYDLDMADVLHLLAPHSVIGVQISLYFEGFAQPDNMVP